MPQLEWPPCVCGVQQRGSQHIQQGTESKAQDWTGSTRQGAEIRAADQGGKGDWSGTLKNMGPSLWQLAKKFPYPHLCSVAIIKLDSANQTAHLETRQEVV